MTLWSTGRISAWAVTITLSWDAAGSGKVLVTGVRNKIVQFGPSRTTIEPKPRLEFCSRTLCKAGPFKPNSSALWYLLFCFY